MKEFLLFRGLLFCLLFGAVFSCSKDKEEVYIDVDVQSAVYSK